MTPAWRVFFSCWLIYTFFWTPYIVREHFPALTLMERGTLNVEKYLAWSEDIFQGPHGGAFINNNPGASMTGAIPLLLLRPLLLRVDSWNQSLPLHRPTQNDGDLFWRALAEGRGLYFLLLGFITVATVMAPLTAATYAFLCVRLRESGVSRVAAAAVSVLCGVATPVLFRSGHLNHNLLVCDAGFLCLLVLWQPNGAPLSRRRAATAGALAGYCLLCDFSGAVVLLVAGLYVWMLSRRCSFLGAYAGGALPFILGLAVYQTWAFGSPYHPSQHYMPATAPTTHGYRGFDWPSARLLWANFFDPRFGLFAYCPLLLLGIAAPFVQRRCRVPRREMLVIVNYVGWFVTFCAANQYSWLQPSTGLRYLVPVVPVLGILAAQTAQAFTRWLRLVVGILALTQSVAISWAHSSDIRLAAPTIWHRRFQLPWMIRLTEAGVPTSWWWPLAWGIALTAILGLIWLSPLVWASIRAGALSWHQRKAIA